MIAITIDPSESTPASEDVGGDAPPGGRLQIPSVVHARLDVIVEMTKRCFGMVSASVTLFDRDRLDVVAGDGSEYSGLPRQNSFCDRVVRYDHVTVVPDASRNPAYHAVEAVVGPPFVRFFAGYPLQGPDRNPIGALCLFDAEPRDFDDAEREALRHFALMTQDALWSAYLEDRPEGGTRTIRPGEPESGEPESGEPESGEPESDEPEPGESEFAEPEHGEPELAEPDSRPKPELDDAGEGTGGLGLGRVLDDEVTRGLVEALGVISSGAYLLDHRWRLLFVNGAGRRFLPAGGAERIGDTLWDIDPSMLHNEFGTAFRTTAAQRTVSSVRAKRTSSSGWFEATIYPVECGIMVFVRDVTTEQLIRVRLDDSIRDLQRRAALLDAANDAIMVVELDGTLSLWNSGAESLYGWTDEEVVGRVLRELIQAGDEMGPSQRAALRDTGSWAGEVRHSKKDGTRITVDCRLQLARDPDGEPAFMLCIVSDASERRRTQDERYRAQRLESLGTLAGGIAHDLNNVFTPILISAQMLLSERLTESGRELLAGIESSVKRGSEMIHQILLYARGQDVPTDTIDTERLLDELVTFCRASLPATIEIRVDSVDDLWPSTGNRTQMLQILMNLVTNARDAMPGGGSLVIRARNRAASEPPGSDRRGTVTGDAITVEVEDTGTGMDAGILATAFEPFFSTKAQGEGTGLGLSTSLSIAQSHGGDLHARSEPGVGSVFTLELPRDGRAGETDSAEPASAEPASAQPGSAESASAAPGSSGRHDTEPAAPPEHKWIVLVVDDEPLVRAVVQRTLEHDGFETLRAASGAEAIEVLRRDGQRIDAVFTDIMMPGMSGLELIGWLVEHRPETAIVAASGVVANRAAIRSAYGERIPFLTKPFTRIEVVDAVAKALGAG